MQKEVISQKQAIIIMSAFIIGSSSVVAAGSDAKQDYWIAWLISISMGAIIVAIYARISKLYPQEEFPAVLNTLFGKVGGTIINLIYTWYAFHLFSLILRNFSEFVGIVSLNQTPSFVFGYFAAVLSIWTIRSGFEVIGRVLSIFFPLFIILVITVDLLSIKLFDFDNLKPVLYDGIGPVLKSSFALFSFPYAETVLFLYLMGSIRKTSSPYKIYYASLLLGGIILASISIRTILIIGVPNISIQKFPIYSAVRLINVADFLQRIESTVAISFIITGYSKGSVCLYVTTKGLSSAFNIKDYRKMVAPIGLLAVLYSIFIFENASEMFYWATEINPYYTIPFQVIIPIIIWITAEIKSRKKAACTL